MIRMKYIVMMISLSKVVDLDRCLLLHKMKILLLLLLVLLLVLDGGRNYNGPKVAKFLVG